MQTPLKSRREVLSPIGNLIFASLWILLVGGRWIIGSFLLATGTTTMDGISDWDDHIGIHLYHILLIATFVIVALRMVRSRSVPPAARDSGEEAEPDQNGLPAAVGSRAPKGRKTL